RCRRLPRRTSAPRPAPGHAQPAAAATPARAAVELHRRVAELAAEAERTANEAAVEHHAGAESGARRQHHERADTTAGTEEELAERERVDVVVDESRKPEALTEHRRQRQPAQLRGVQRLVADAARRAVDQPGHAGADSRDVESATRRLGPHDGD